MIMLFFYFSGCALEIDSGFSNWTQFCIGENITLFCSGGGGAYDWRVPSFSLTLSTGISQLVDKSTLGFTARRLSDTSSSLSVIAFNRLNNATILCVDGGNGDILSSAIMGVFGM